jgi:tRNA(fMet)-specific endonuclease VapC
MSGKFLLDTNIIIALFAQDPSVQKPLSKAQEVFVPGIVLGELYYGAYKSTHVRANFRTPEVLDSILILKVSYLITTLFH